MVSTYAEVETIHRAEARDQAMMAEHSAKVLAWLEARPANAILGSLERKRIEERRVDVALFREKAAVSIRKAEYYSKLSHKYERAAANPWLSVEPDPPEPK